MTDIQASGWICVLMGGGALIQGIRFRSGISRKDMADNYRNMRLPRMRRNSPFAGIPIGLGFLLIGVAAVKGGDFPPGLVFGLAAAGLVFAIVGLLVVVSPPGWSKPRWLREAEAAGWQDYRAGSHRGDVVFSAIVAISAFGAIAVIIATSFQLVDLVGPLLLGLGTALAFWRGRRRTGRP